MAVSVFDLFKIGIGPSSSHTVGPMRAAQLWGERLRHAQLLAQVARVVVTLQGSLAFTGSGHATDIGVLLGLSGYAPDSVPMAAISQVPAQIRAMQQIELAAEQRIVFDVERDLIWDMDTPVEQLPHPNSVLFVAYDTHGQEIASQGYSSVGGGFVLAHGADAQHIIAQEDALAHPFHDGAELLAVCEAEQCSIAEIVARNELLWRKAEHIDEQLAQIWSAMNDAIERGCHAISTASSETNILPGGMSVQRRAARMYARLQAQAQPDGLQLMDRVSIYAIAVNEENAAGARIVTAPTNGAAGVVPAVLRYALEHVAADQPQNESLRTFLLTAAAIGMLYKRNASISGAEVGCQGEVGVASSMAAAGLAALMGGSPEQVENAAEIAMEHHLGMTCDPVGGLVQIPCIERNAMGAIKAINAARLAMQGDGSHRVSLDVVIKTMRDTGRDMQGKYKETAQGGLAVNVVAC